MVSRRFLRSGSSVTIVSPIEVVQVLPGVQTDASAIQVTQVATEAIFQGTLDTNVAIYSITKPDIVNAIAAAEKRGVKVPLITDKTEAGNKYQKATRLRD